MIGDFLVVAMQYVVMELGGWYRLRFKLSCLLGARLSVLCTRM